MDQQHRRRRYNFNGPFDGGYGGRHKRNQKSERTDMKSMVSISLWNTTDLSVWSVNEEKSVGEDEPVNRLLLIHFEYHRMKLEINIPDIQSRSLSSSIQINLV